MAHPTRPHAPTADPAERRLAEYAALADIEDEGVPVRGRGARAYDVRLMTDPREHCPEFCDMARVALDYAERRGLVRVLERQADGSPAIVRIVHDGRG